MAKQIVIDIPHTLGIAEARRRAAEGIEKLARKLPGGGEVVTSWPSENELQLDIAAMGNTIGVVARIEAQMVRMTLTLPLMLSLASGPIAQTARDAVEKMLRDESGTAPPPR